MFQYAHCCPLTYKQFLKYTNIKQLAEELSHKRNLNKKQQHLVLNRFYILFYLAPEHRYTSLFNRICLSENCPQTIKDKYFLIPTKLFLKEDKTKEVLTKTQEVVSQDSKYPKSDNIAIEAVKLKDNETTVETSKRTSEGKV